MADGFAPADAALKEEKLKEIRLQTSRKMFDSVDADKSGFIEADEFQRLCRKLDATMTQNDIQLAMKLLDESGDGVISFEEFSAWWAAGDPAANLAQLRSAVSAADTVRRCCACEALRSLKIELRPWACGCRFYSSMWAFVFGGSTRCA
jgi:hypothetical protein